MYHVIDSSYHIERDLKGNTQLVEIHPDAFAGLTSLRRLDASQTGITQLPTRGLSELEILRLTDTKSLKEIPSVYNFQVELFISCCGRIRFFFSCHLSPWWITINNALAVS